MNFLKRKLIWLVLGAGARYVIKLGTMRTVDQARDDLADRLPQPVVNVADRLPVDPLRTSSSILVVGKATKQVVLVSSKAKDHAASGIRNVNVARHRLQQLKETVRSDFYSEIDQSARELRSQYHRTVDGEEAATDALLDLRSGETTDDDLMVPPPISRGRRHWRPSKKSTVNRMQRSYRPRMKPWD